MSVRRVALLTVLVCCLAAGAPLFADEAPTGWTDTAELSFVSTAGNSASSSIGFKNVAARAWEKSLLTLRASGIRVESESGSSVAVDLGGGNFRVIDPDSEVTAEAYQASGRYDRKITERMFWFGGLGWGRNEFAGIKNRYIAEAGVGNIWYDTDDLKFSTTYGLTYTDQEDVSPTPGLSDTFAGVRAGWNYLNVLSKTATYTNVLTVDLNLDETDDWRADMDNGLSVSMSEKTAIKLGLRFLYDNNPAMETLVLLDAAPPTGAPIGTQMVELDELDTIFTASVVINFK